MLMLHILASVWAYTRIWFRNALLDARIAAPTKYSLPSLHMRLLLFGKTEFGAKDLHLHLVNLLHTGRYALLVLCRRSREAQK